MSQTSVDFINLFVRPPGDLLYFLAVIAMSQAGLFIALGRRLRHPEDRAAGRYTLAALGVVLAWLLLMVGALYALFSNQPAAAILPPLERTANVVTILLLGWAFLTADHERWGRSANVILLGLLALVIVGYIITGTRWPNLVSFTDFNLSVFGVAWTSIAAALSLLGMVLMIVYLRVVTDAPLKLVFFLVLGVGYIFTLLQIAQGSIIGNYAGPARLAFLAALPLMPAIIYRMVISHLEAEAANRAVVAPAPARVAAAPAAIALPAAEEARSPLERESVQLLKALGLILEEATPLNIPERVVQAGLEMLKADVGALLTLHDANYADITSAYDKAMQRKITALALNLDDQPTLVNAIERTAQRPLYPDRNEAELRDLYTRLDIEPIGPTYFQPLTHEKEIVAVLMVGMPYSGRELRPHELELLKGMGIISSSVLALSYQAQEASAEAEERAIQAMLQGVARDEVEEEKATEARREAQASLEQAREQIAELNYQVTQLTIELDTERTRVASVLSDTQEGLSISQRLIALNDEQQKLRDERDQFAQRLQEAETALAGATATDQTAIFKTVVSVLRREKDELLAQRQSLTTQLEELRAASTQTQTPVTVAMQDMIDRMAIEKKRLEQERNQLSDQLTDLEAQLKALGIEGGAAGLAQLIGQLNEQKTALQTRYDMLKLDRDALFNERTQLEDNITQESERDAQMKTLQTEVEHLAADREAVTKQRDKLREERDELASKQEVVKEHRTRLLAENAAFQQELAEAHELEGQLRTDLQRLADERSELVSHRDRLLAEKQAVETERDQLLARVEGDRDRLQQLGEDGVGSLTKMIDELSEQRNQLEQELNETRTALAALENELDMLRVRSTSIPSSQQLPAYQPENADLILGLVQELRTPMTSIVGYIELLLGESAGILGEMQRKFLQRVAANITRLASMIEDLIHLTALDTGKFTLSAEPVDVLAIIEDAITNASNQFREKGLTVHLNLDETIPLLRADRDAISQIIGQLLTNAYLVSIPDNQIFITARREVVDISTEGEPKPTDSLYVAVEDRGGGIAPEDQPRVFARKYKAENPLIQGLGDTGVGLAIAKALVEAHGGKLWLESQEGVGSTFYFALPLNTTLEPESEG